MVDNGNLGSPKGRITLDTSGVTQAKTVVVAAAQEMNRAFNSTNPAIQGVANNFRIAQQAARSFADTDLGAIQQGLQGVAQRFTLISAAAGAATAGGIAAAQSVRQLTSTYAALLGSGERAQAVLTEIRDLSEEYKLPFLEAANGAKGFLAVINSSNLSMRDLVLTSQRLRLLNQAEGAEGAAFALKELLANDVTSIVERFNISRTAVNAIKAEANGDQEKILQGLNEYLDRIGVTEAALMAMGQSGANAFSRLRGSLTEAASTAFTPFLETVVLPLAEGMAGFLNTLRESNPLLLQAGSVFTVLTAGVAPLLLVLNQAISAYRTLRLVSATAMGGTLTSLGVGAAAIGGGAILGVGAAQFLADRGIGDQRLRSDSGEDPMAVIGDRIKQLIMIWAEAVTQLARGIAAAKMMLDNAFGILASVFREGGLIIQMAFLQLQQGLLRLLGQDTEAIGEQIKVVRAQIGLERDELRPDSIGLSEDQNTALETAFQNVRQDFLNGVMNFLWPPMEEAAEAGAETITRGGTSLGDALLNAAKSPKWKDILDAIEENARKIKEANDERLIGVGREAEDFARGRMRALADEQKQNDRLQRQQFERERQQIAAIAELQTEASKEEAQLLTKDLQEREREFEEHNRRLLDIQRQGHFAIVDAIADGDGVAAVRAVRNAQEQTRKENEDFALRQKQRNEDLQEQRKSLTDQRDERLRDAVQQLNDMRVQFAEQRAEREADFWERLGREDEDRSIRLQREQEDFDRRRALELADNQRRLVEMQSQFFVEAGLFQSFQSTVSTVFQRIRDDGVRYFTDLYRSMMGLGAYGAPNTPLNGIGMIGGGASVRAIPQAASGAMLLSDGLVYAHNREIILNEAQQRSYLGGGSYQVQVSAPITVIANEPFDYEGMVEDVTDRLTTQVAETIRRVRDAQ